MALGGKRPGAGRKKASKNKATILRETKRAEVIAEMVDTGKPLAVTVLQKAMEFAEGSVIAYKPTTKQERERGLPENPDGDPQIFGQWFDRWFKCAEILARYQTPMIKAIDRPTEAPSRDTDVIEFTLRVFEGGRMVSGPQEIENGEETS